MVTSALARNVCFTLTAKLQIPTFLLHLQPLVPTTLYPHYSDTEDCLEALQKYWAGKRLTDEEASKNLESYWFLEKFQHDFLESAMVHLYHEHEMKTPPPTWEETQTILSGNHPNIHLVNSFYDELVPATREALMGSCRDDSNSTGRAPPPHIHYVGPLADHYIPKNYQPDAKLQAFLVEHAGEKPTPICIGFGSMPYGQASLILLVLQKLQRRAVLVGNVFLELQHNSGNEERTNLDWDWIHANVCSIESVPYAWLLPQCSMMVCHGGAGVTQTTLRAGIPIVISPVMGDQFFFAPLVEGARAGSTLAGATADDFLQAISKADTCQVAAQRFREQVPGKSGNGGAMLGVERMVQLLEETLIGSGYL